MAEVITTVLSKQFVVHLLVCTFGIGSWISINGLWVELPLLVQELPEKWKLPSYLAIIIQCANIGTIVYTLGNIFKPHIIREIPTVYVLVSVGLISSLLLSILWKETTYILGVNHATALLTLVFFLALVDCTSSVVFTPFMVLFKEIYLTSFFIGEGLSGFVPSLLALVQGVGGNPKCLNVSTTKEIIINETIYNETTFNIISVQSEPRFSVTIFFGCIFSMMFLCGLAFLLLNHLQVCLDEQVEKKDNTILKSVKKYNSFDSTHSLSDSNIIKDDKDFRITYIVRKTSVLNNSSNFILTKYKIILLLCAQGWICFFHTGGLLAIQSYSCLPYGYMAYHLSVSLSSMANPLACFIALFFPAKKYIQIICLFIIGNICGSYILTLAIQSPEPPLFNRIEGQVLVILAWILCSGSFSFTKLSIAACLRNKGQKGLLWYGSITQLGSALGALVMFFLVNVAMVFRSKDACS